MPIGFQCIICYTIGDDYIYAAKDGGCLEEDGEESD